MSIFFNGQLRVTPGVYSEVISVPPETGDFSTARRASGLDGLPEGGMSSGGSLDALSFDSPDNSDLID